MELTASHAIQGLIMLATIASGYAIVKNNLSRVMHDLEDHVKQCTKQRINFDTRLDEAESKRAVMWSQIDILKEINSVSALEFRNRELATIQADLRVLHLAVEHLQHIHNSKHPMIEK